MPNDIEEGEINFESSRKQQRQDDPFEEYERLSRKRNTNESHHHRSHHNRRSSPNGRYSRDYESNGSSYNNKRDVNTRRSRSPSRIHRNEKQPTQKYATTLVDERYIIYSS